MSTNGRDSNGWPLPFTDWKHKKGTVYSVDKITNGDSDRHEEYPPTVVYYTGDQEWSRPCSRWTDDSMTYIGPTPRPRGMVDVDEVKQICRDYSSRTGNVYIKDVESSLDGLLIPRKLPQSFYLMTSHEMQQIQRALINEGKYNYESYGSAIERRTLEQAGYYRKPEKVNG
jgi:hypothetical protein